jgi:glycosyltransferase involved in cell wall biosynthesis
VTEMVSVVIAVLNGAKTIRRAVDSALGQTWKDREIIVVDDGSTDKTFEILRAYGDTIRVIRQSNHGVSVARNIGIEQAKGDYIAFLDADDEWLPQKLDIQLGILRAMPDVGLLGGGTEWLREHQRRLRVPRCGEIEITSLLWSNPICTTTAIIRASVLRECGLRFWPELRCSEDWHLWIRLAGHSRVWNDGRVVARHHVTEGGISTRDRASLLTRYGRVYELIFSNLVDDPAVSAVVRQHWDDISLNIELLKFRILVARRPLKALAEWLRIAHRSRNVRQICQSARSLAAGIYCSLRPNARW